MKKEFRPYSVAALKSLSPYLFEDDSLTVGGVVKSRGEVLMQRERYSARPPNTSCRIETFTRICQSFDERKTRWVIEMGFGGMLKFVGDMHMPRKLSYWLFTRIDPFNYTLKSANGKLFNLSKNQVHWVLGIPNRGCDVPTYKSLSSDRKEKVDEILARYGKFWVMYLDRLDRQPVQWGVFPRLQVWSMEQISRAVKADRMLNGDFGVVGTLDVAYGENHPRLARDTDGPQEQDEGLCVRMVSKWKNRTPRRMSNRKNLRQYWPRVTGHGTTYADILKSSANDASVVVVELVGFKKEQLRRWMYVAGVFAHKLVSDAVLRFGSKSCWCLAKYPFCLPVFLHSRGGAFYLNERMSPVLELFKAFFRDGCCRLLSYVSHVSFLFRLTETTVRQWMIGCLFLNTVPQAIRPLFCIIWVVEHHQHK